MQNRGNALYNLREFLKKDNGDGYKKVINLLKKNEQLNTNVYQPMFSSTIEHAYPFFLDPLPLNKILLWYSNLILAHKEIIETFELKKSSFEKYTLSEDYDSAYRTAKEIENDFGISMWLLDCYSVLETFSQNKYDFKKDFDENTLNAYSIFSIKNLQNERQPQYIHRINHLLSKIDNQYASYYKYKLFSELPFQEEFSAEINWKNVLVTEGANALVDIYLVTVDCLHYYTSPIAKNPPQCISKCIELIAQIDTPICNIIASSFLENTESNVDYENNNYIQLIEKNKFEELVDYFYTNGFEDYDNFSSYRYTAISALHSSLPNTDSSALFIEILKNVYQILKKEDYGSVDEASSRLRILSRILRSFTIHKGMCIFLEVSLNLDKKYSISQQVCTVGDQVLIDYELNNDIACLLAYRALYTDEIDLKTSEEHIATYDSYIQTGTAPNYYETARLKTLITNMCNEGAYFDAICLFVCAYIKNPFLLYVIDIGNIREYLEKKIKDQEDMDLEELCYVFIDGHFKEYHKSCYLNYLDYSLLEEPLNIIDLPQHSSDVIDFFLAKICTVEMLNSIYTLFDSSDDAKDYRMKICQFLYMQKRQFSKEAKNEHRELAKNKAMHQKLINVDRSRVSIDTLSIREEVYEDIEYQMDACNSQMTENFSSQSKDTVVILCPQIDSYLCMYESYAKTFCFGSNGLDTSLSTRVRHGAFINQIFRTFDENSLIYSESVHNELFDPMFQSQKLKQEIKPLLSELHNQVQIKLEYFTQHTLKVFIDKPIEGAVFDYSISNVDDAELNTNFIVGLITGKITDANSAIQTLHQILIQKTNDYLEAIRNKYLPELKIYLLDLLNGFSNECIKYANDITTKQEIQRKISQCETALQNEFKTVTSWFYLSEYEVWEEYTFNELIEMCIEITKKLFSEFSQVKINKCINLTKTCSGKTFRSNTDILLILLNNCFTHAGFDEHPRDLEINCTVQENDSCISLIVENNLSDSVDMIQLQDKIDQINENFSNEAYKHMNTRQEGGMGLYKIMLILHHTMDIKDSFYISLDENKIKVEIKLRKEIICDQKDIIS